ncbi:hypothetical protein HDV00_007657 [Rhizophlyctis rosea]|nr:hypothetical protein HDV00_007657 [Rhizophlyctis rosea]
MPASILDLDTAAPPLSSDRRLRVARVMKKSENRASVHVSQFYRINVMLPRGETLRLTVDKDRTIDYLTKQIEAEYAFKYLLEEGRESRIKEEGGRKPRPLSITQIYDSGMLALKFGENVGDVLSFDDTVFIVDATETDSGTASSGELLNQSSADASVPSTGEGVSNALLEAESVEASAPVLSTTPSVSFGAVIEVPPQQPTPPRPRQYSLISNPTLDDRLQAMLHNKMSIRFFIDFCLSEYTIENILFWLDVETFQTSPTAVRAAYAKYIYLIYVAVEAPLQVNLSAEVRKDVPWPLPADLKGEEVDVTMFDEAQQQAYAMMKGHSFVRYEKSSFANAYVEARRAGPYSQYFSIDSERLEGVSKLLEDPKSPSAQEILRSLGESAILEVESALFREALLTMIIAQKFPKHSNVVVEGYFSDTNRVTWAQKQRKMQKEKKLSKFFGARVTPEQIQRQFQTSPRVSVTDFGVLFAGEGSIKKGTMEVEEDTDDNESAGDEDAVTTNQRRKKKEKLENLFGEKLPGQHKKAQQIVVPTATPDTLSMAAVEPDPQVSVASSLDDAEAMVPVETTNDLNAEERRILQRRIKKLAAKLGESLDERTVSENVRAGVGSTMKASRSGSMELLKGSGVWDGASGKLEKNGSFASKIFTAAEIDRTMGVPEYGLHRTYSDSSLFSHTTQSTVDEPEIDTKLSNKRRLDKLSHMMGERIGRDHLDQAAAAQKVPVNGRRALTIEERKAFQKKAAKLERLLGQVPAADDLISAPPPVQRVRRSIAYVRAVVGQTTDVVDLIEKLSSLSEEGPPNVQQHLYHPTDRISIASTSDASSDTTSIASMMIDQQTKESRLRRLNKLRKFFGDHISVAQLLEQELLSDLEREIEEDVEDIGERSALKTEVESLRLAMKERDAELSSEFSLSTGSDVSDLDYGPVPRPITSKPESVEEALRGVHNSNGSLVVELPHLDFGGMSFAGNFLEGRSSAAQAILPVSGSEQQKFLPIQKPSLGYSDTSA